MSTTGRYITYTNNHGLANRLRLHVMAHAYALYRKRQLVVNWKRNASCYATYHDLFLDGPPALSQLGFRQRAELLANRILSCRSFNRGDVAKGQTIEDLPQCRRRLVHFRQDLNANVERGSRLGRYHQQVLEALRPRPEITTIVDDITAGFSSMTVGLHIRLGDFQDKYGSRLPPLERYIKIASTVKMLAPDAEFYLVSDAPVERLSPLIDAVGARHRTTSARRDSLEGIRDALADIYILAATRLIISTPYTSFSAFAAFLGDRPLFQAHDDWQSVSARLPQVIANGWRPVESQYLL